MRENKDQKNSEYGHFSHSVRDEAFEMQLSFHVHKLDLPLWSALKLLLSNCSCKKSKNKFCYLITRKQLVKKLTRIRKISVN